MIYGHVQMPLVKFSTLKDQSNLRSYVLGLRPLVRKTLRRRLRNMRDDYLFNEVDMFSVMEHQKKCAAEAVLQVESGRLLQADENDLIGEIVKQFALDVPVIQDDKIYVADYGEAQVDVSHEFNRYISD